MLSSMPLVQLCQDIAWPIQGRLHAQLLTRTQLGYVLALTLIFEYLCFLIIKQSIKSLFFVVRY